MKEPLISFEIAKLAKKKGFVEPCRTKYIVMKTKTKQQTNRIRVSSTVKSNWYLAPTQSFLQQWLREKHEIYVNIMVYNIPFLYSEVSVTFQGTIRKFYLDHNNKFKATFEKRHSGGTNFEDELNRILIEALNLIS